MISQQSFGCHLNGQAIISYTLSLPNGAAVEILNYGGIVRSLIVPDRDGIGRDVVLGLSNPCSYLDRHPYFGAIVGRIAGRVPRGQICVDDTRWQLPLNEGKNHLHGGHRGLDRRIWEPLPCDRGASGAAIQLAYFSPHGEEGYPGNVSFKVTYRLTPPCTFTVETEATTDRATPVCLAHHSYFNLTGGLSADALQHLVFIQADATAEVDDAFSFTGRRIPCVGSSIAFRTASVLRDVVGTLPGNHGNMYFLHPPCRPRPAFPIKVARLYEETSGIGMDVVTDEACMQFYTGSALDSSWTGKDGKPLGRYAGVCFECQGYPDGSRNPQWGNIVVRPGEPQKRHTQYVFSSRNTSP